MNRSKVNSCFKKSVMFVKGKTYTNAPGYIARVFGDYSLEVYIDGRPWEPVDSVYVYLYSSKFALIMEALFNDQAGGYDKKSAANSYLPRKLRNDTHGCLAMGMPQIETSGQRFILSNGGVNIPIEDFLEAVQGLSSCADIFEFLYQSDIGQLFVTIEGAWVLCYICAERGLDQQETKQVFDAGHKQPFSAKSKAFDNAALETFFRAYKAVSNELIQSRC